MGQGISSLPTDQMPSTLRSELTALQTKINDATTGLGTKAAKVDVPAAYVSDAELAGYAYAKSADVYTKKDVYTKTEANDKFLEEAPGSGGYPNTILLDAQGSLKFKDNNHGIRYDGPADGPHIFGWKGGKITNNLGTVMSWNENEVYVEKPLRLNSNLRIGDNWQNFQIGDWQMHQENGDARSLWITNNAISATNKAPQVVLKGLLTVQNTGSTGYTHFNYPVTNIPNTNTPLPGSIVNYIRGNTEITGDLKIGKWRIYENGSKLYIKRDGDPGIAIGTGSDTNRVEISRLNKESQLNSNQPGF